MQSISTGVLVIGGGGAAARAALEARLAGAEVTLVSKGNFGAIGTRGAGATAGGGSAASVFATPGWTGPLSEIEKRLKYMAAPEPDQAYNNIIQAGLGMADPKLVNVLINDAVETRQKLIEWGATFSEPGMRSHGVPIMAALVNECRRRGVVIRDGMAIVKLLVRDGECIGAVGVDERTGDIVGIKAAATIIGTGGDAHLFMHNLNPSGNTGDGYVLGYEAGAELMNLEFKQIFLGTIHPTINMLTQVFPPHVRLLNGHGQEFVGRYAPAGTTVEECLAQRGGHNPFSTRDRLSRYVDIAIVNEVRLGNGTPHGGVYLDRTDLRVPPMPEQMREFWEYRGIDFSRPVEVGVCHHCSLGGLKIDENAETGVAHLYAAGEAAAGPHGADRMGGHMLLASQVFGARAGRHAAAYARTARTTEADAGILNNIEAEMEAVRNNPGRRNPREVKDALEETAYFNLLVIRSESSLKTFTDDIAEIKREMVPDIKVTVPRDLVEALELRNLIKLAEIEAAICLMRTESRGPHYREDYPEQDDAGWLKSIVVKKSGDAIKLDTVTLDPSWVDKGDKGIGYWG